MTKSPAPLPCPGPLDLADAELRRDPYPVYRWYREHDPVHCLEPKTPGAKRRYLLTRWEDVEAGLKDGRLRREVHAAALWNQEPSKVAPEFATYVRVFGAWPLFMDPPRHAKVRRPVNRVLDEAMNAAAEPLLGELLEEISGRLRSRHTCDLVADYALQIPLELDRRMFGLTTVETATLGTWLQTIGTALGNVFDAQRIAAASRAMDEIIRHLEVAIARCRSRETNAPMLRRLLEITGLGGMVAEEQLIPLALLLLQAAQDSVIGTLVNGLLTFLRCPEARCWCLSKDGRFFRAVDEVLRFESPVQQVTRHAMEPLEIRGVPIQQGEGVSFLLGAANRDPQVFANPDSFDVQRGVPQVASFGFGPHRCPGMDLGRLIAVRAWEAFFTRFPHATHVEQRVEWRNTVTFRTVARLPVDLDGASSQRTSLAPHARQQA